MSKFLEPQFTHDVTITLPANCQNIIEDVEKILNNAEMYGIWSLVEDNNLAFVASNSGDGNHVYLRFKCNYPSAVVVEEVSDDSISNIIIQKSPKVLIHTVIIAQPKESNEIKKGRLYISSKVLDFKENPTYNDFKKRVVSEGTLECQIYSEQGILHSSMSPLPNGFYVVYMYGTLKQQDEFNLKFHFKLLNENSVKSFIGAIFLDFMQIICPLSESLNDSEDYLMLKSVNVRRVLRKYERAVELMKQIGKDWLHINDAFVEKLTETRKSNDNLLELTNILESCINVLSSTLQKQSSALSAITLSPYYSGPQVSSLQYQLAESDVRKHLKALQDVLASFRRTNLNEVGVYQVIGWIKRLKNENFLKISKIDENVALKLKTELSRTWITSELERCKCLDKLYLTLYNHVQEFIETLQILNSKSMALIANLGQGEDYRRLFHKTSVAMGDASMLLELIRDEKPENWPILKEEVLIAQKCLTALQNVLPLMEGVVYYEERKDQLRRLIETKLKYTRKWNREERQVSIYFVLQ